MPPALLLLNYTLKAVYLLHLPLIVPAVKFILLGFLLKKAGIAAVPHTDTLMVQEHRLRRHIVKKITVM